MELVLFIGLPGSGKTTFYREHFARTHVHVSKDDFPNARNREARQRRLIEQAFAEGRSVVVDNTNVTAAARAGPISIARAHGARVVGTWFDVPLDACLERNRGREGRRRVPDVAVRAMASRFEPPSPAEGFDELHVVGR